MNKNGFLELDFSTVATNGCNEVKRKKRSPGRVPSNGERKYQVQNIWNVHHRVMQLALLGFKQTDIARMLSVSEVMVSYTLNSELVKKQLTIMRGAADAEVLDLAIEIRKIAPRALERMKELMENSSDNIALSAAKDILDRAGYGATKRLDISHHITEDDIREIKERAALCTDLTDVIDIDVIDSGDKREGEVG